MLGYLLHLLVKHEKQDGLVSLPIEHSKTVALFHAAQNTIALVPDFSEEHGEHRNGARASHNFDISDFSPESGLGNPLLTAQEVAYRLLVAIGDPHFIDENGQCKSWPRINEEIANNRLNPLEILSGRIVDNRFNPSNSPLQFILIQDGNFTNHSLAVPEIRENFQQGTKNRLPMYTYGAKNFTAADYLHVSEEDIRGLLLGEIVVAYHRNHAIKEKPSMDSEKKSAGGPNFYAPINGPVTVVTGDQKDFDINNTTTINTQTIEELQKELEKLRQSVQSVAQHEQFSELVSAIEQIKSEIAKKEKPNSTILEKAKKVLEGFKTAEGIAGSIGEIIKLLAKLSIF